MCFQIVSKNGQKEMRVTHEFTKSQKVILLLLEICEKKMQNFVLFVS